MSRISAVIITFNESNNIARCIRSLSGIADEIIVSDSYSTDDTVKIAAELGAKVILHRFSGYGATKNNANDHAQYDWILSVDADEEPDEQLSQSIARIKKELPANTVYEFQRLNNYCGKWIKHGGWYPDKKVRLFNRTQVKWNLAEVHETLEIPTDLKRVLLEGKLLHYSYASETQHLSKVENYSTRGAEEAKKKGKHASFIKLYLSPSFRFLRDYIFKLGFLDGYYGFSIARITAKEVYLKYKKLKAMT
ncbi:MAG: glycosyltransferase family 2 protein [Bacteroidota bacterium]